MRKSKALDWLNRHAAHQGDECLIWPYSRNNTGYGQMGYQGKMQKAHRFMCELAHGLPPSAEYEASHSCGNGGGGCVNPSHLSWKTRSENQLDRRRHGTANTNPRGQAGKLTYEQKLEILALGGTMTQAVIAERYGVHFETISRILRTPREKLFNSRVWQPHEDEKLRALLGTGLTAKQMSKQIGRPEGAIYARAARLGLKGFNKR